MVLKQESPFFEHFYSMLRPWEHYVPVSRDLSDLKDRVIWAREHDDEARKISENARKFANENLLPQHIICYHAVLFSVSAPFYFIITIPSSLSFVGLTLYFALETCCTCA